MQNITAKQIGLSLLVALVVTILTGLLVVRSERYVIVDSSGVYKERGFPLTMLKQDVGDPYIYSGEEVSSTYNEFDVLGIGVNFVAYFLVSVIGMAVIQDSKKQS